MLVLKLVGYARFGGTCLGEAVAGGSLELTEIFRPRAT